MTAVLLDSTKTGSTAWFRARKGSQVKIRGMEDGDHLVIHFKPEGQMSIDEDSILSLPESVEMVSAEHVRAASRENGGVNVDVVRKA